MQTVVVPLGETNISKLFNAFFIFIRSPLLEIWLAGPAKADDIRRKQLAGR